jgi:hypothetical protein
MIVCSKCKIEKDNKEYYTYFHSTQQKHRTRKVCQECCAKQKKNYKQRIRQEKLRMKEILTQPEKVAVIAPELQPDLFKGNPLYKFCKNCNQYKLLTDYYVNKGINGYATWCKVCHNSHTRQKQTEYYQNKYKNNGGSERVLSKPNNYTDEYQKEQTFWVMELMGWTYNENGVFSKDGIKDKDNNWMNVKNVPKKKKEIGVRVSREYDVDKIKELRENGLFLNEIAKIMKCSKPTVMKLLKTAYLS